MKKFFLLVGLYGLMGFSIAHTMEGDSHGNPSLDSSQRRRDLVTIVRVEETSESPAYYVRDEQEGSEDLVVNRLRCFCNWFGCGILTAATSLSAAGGFGLVLYIVLNESDELNPFTKKFWD